MANHRLIAAAAGVSTATVSRALSGHPHVRPDVRARVESAARALGYEPDPRLAILSRLRWGRGRRPESAVIAVLCDRFTSQGRGKFRALTQQARELGYELEIVTLEPARVAGRNLGREFFHRGIRGLLVNLHDPAVLPEIEWERFSVVMVGEERPELPFHRVGTDWRQAYDLLCGRALAEGHRRIGLSLARYTGVELNRLVLAEALLHREELVPAGAADVPLFRFHDSDPAAERAYAAWRRAHRITCVIANDRHPQAWRKDARTPRLLQLGLPDDPGCASGVDLQLGGRYSAALRLLHDLMLLDRRGFSPEPTRTLYPVAPGWTATPPASGNDSPPRTRRR